LLTPPYVLLCAGVCLAAHAPNLFIVAPRFLRAMGQDERHIGMIMGSFPLASLVAMPLWARIAERHGARFLLTVGAIGVAVGCALFEVAPDVPAWMGARALQGLGWSGVLIGSSLAASSLAPPGRLTQALGLAGVLTLVAMAMGPLLGEALVTHARWPWVFRTAALAALAGAVLTSRLPRLRARGASIEPTTAAVPGAFADARGERAARWRPLAAMVLVATGFGAVVSFLADHSHLVGGFGVSAFFDAYVAAAIVVRLGCGRLPDRVGAHRVLVPSFVGQALALLALALFGARWQLVPAGALFGVTHGLYYPTMTALVVKRASAARRARAVASVHFAFSSGMVLAAFAGGALASALGYRVVYATTAALATIGVAIAFVDGLTSRPGRSP
jgi:MFS family permease